MSKRRKSKRSRVSGRAIASIIASLVWLLGIGSVLGIILGIAAIREIAKSRGCRTGLDFAAAGIGLGLIGIVLAVWFLSQPFDIIPDVSK